MSNNKTEIVSQPNPINTAPGASHDSPGVLVFPPALYVGTLLLGLLLQYLWPARLSTAVWDRIGGAILFLASGVLALWGRRTMLRAGTNVIPSQPALAIVTEGPFRFTRNPLYLANALAYLGLTLVFNTVWPIVLFVPMLAVLRWGIIGREERYLEAKFGETYLTYKARVRRWL